MYNLDLEYKRYHDIFNTYLSQKLETLNIASSNTIKDAMIYAVSDGGKRVRPILCFATAEMLGVGLERVKNYALAIEFIHSYSLVHDDLPSMDNDDYRRGKLSTHKKFGEGIGVLVGDALLNFAFETCLDNKSFNNCDINAMRVISEFAGYSGMIAGQVLDLQNEKSSSINEKTLYEIFENKTAKLIMAPILVSSCIAKNKYFDALKCFGYNLGIMFQITDDILDVEGNINTLGKTPNKDKNSDKLTSVKLFGLDGAKERAKFHYKNCLNALSGIPNNDFLLSFTDKMFKRKN